MSDRRTVVLDFDGVICDSVAECLVTGWMAYLEVQGKRRTAHVGDDKLDRALTEFFLSKRWLVGPPEHYYLVFRAYEEGSSLDSEEDLVAAAALHETMLLRYRRTFFDEREKAKASDPARWVGMHRIYPSVARHFNALADSASVIIATTKDAKSVESILTWSGLRIPEIVGASAFFRAGSKGELIRNLFDRGTNSKSDGIFLDDHVGHLRSVKAIGVRSCLAAWGYVQPASRTDEFPTYETFDDFLAGEHLAPGVLSVQDSGRFMTG